MRHASLSDLTFGSRFVEALPADPDTRNMPRQVHGACWSNVAPTKVPAPRLLAHSAEVAADLGLAPEAYADSMFAEVLAGNRGSPPSARRGCHLDASRPMNPPTDLTIRRPPQMSFVSGALTRWLWTDPAPPHQQAGTRRDL